MRPRLSYANVMATIAVFIALGGASYAALKLPKNSVGTKQLRNNAVVTAKVKKEAITASKVKKGTLTGTQINAATLGTVPNAQTATSANTASSIAAPEPWSIVSAPGEPNFQNGWANAQTKKPPDPEPIAFFKDHEGVVHLRGLASGPAEEVVIFQLPAGYRPGVNRFSIFDNGQVRIYGSGMENPGFDGAVVAPLSKLVSFEGIAFRAES
jgi:hypothetical protein